VVIVIGANPTVNHPGGRHLDQERVQNGTKLIVMDPRKSDLRATRTATCSSSPTPTWRCSTR
jgi:predicted molibdopterin-dependent oxidoreductase YjgC